MPLSRSIIAYDDVRNLLDRALMTEKGLRVRFETHNKAMQFRHKMNYFRKLDRHESRSIYLPGDPLYGKTIYDKLEFRIVDGETHSAIDILKRDAIEFDVEEIG